MKLLLHNGVDVSIKDKCGKTAEQVAKTTTIRDLIRSHSKNTATEPPLQAPNNDDEEDNFQYTQSIDNLYSKKRKLAQLRHDYEVDMAALDFEAKKQETETKQREADMALQLQNLQSKIVLEKAQCELALEKLAKDRAAKKEAALNEIQSLSDQIQQMEGQEDAVGVVSEGGTKNDNVTTTVIGSEEETTTESNDGSVESFVQVPK